MFAGVAFFFWLFNFSTLPLSNPELMKLSNGEGLLDLRIYYTAREAFHAMAHYGSVGRTLYLRFLATDFVFLVIYGLAFSLLFARMALALFNPTSPWRKINLLPLGIALADFVEDTCLLLLLTGYPERYLFIGTLAGMATLTKHVLTISALSFLAYGCLRLLTRGFGSKKRLLTEINNLTGELSLHIFTLCFLQTSSLPK
ncbi:MAG TPA: hypothetical protein DCS42_09115 [Nitrospiraceae bacterium]|nr:MAG: hypothetical protein A2X57_07555 [Nitrospirae bacterium GWD2_57_8]HAR45478.1 hypothetical protein [Nitrospiraceae bacterium]HAS54260.1 hypothetical protein [Nitrospiraceae bacterium]